MYKNLTDAQAQEIWDLEVAGTPPADRPEDNPEAADLLDQGSASDDSTGGTAEVNVDPDNQASGDTQKVEDPYAGLSPVVRAQLEKIAQIEQQNVTLQQSLKTAEGRVSAMQREMDLAKKAKAQAGGEAPSDGQIQRAAGSLEKWERLKADFPDWGEAMEELVASRLGGTPANQPAVNLDEVAGAIFEQTQLTREQLTRELEMAKVELKYENWTEDVKTDDFKAWMAVQADEVKSLAQSDKAKDATKMLGLYYESKAKPVTAIKEERNARIAAAVTQKGTGAPAPKSVDDMTPEELWAYEARMIEKRGSY